MDVINAINLFSAVQEAQKIANKTEKAAIKEKLSE